MDPLTVSGLQQPSVNLGGLLGMGSLSGNTGTMSGGTQGGPGGAGMTGGMDLAQLLEMLNQQQGEQSAVGLGQPLGASPVSIAQQQASGQMMGNLSQGSYLTAGGGTTNGTPGGNVTFGNTDVDPLAIVQKVLGLAQKGVALTGNSNTSLLANDPGNPNVGGQESFQSPSAGNMQDFSGLDAVYQQLLQASQPQGAGFGFYPNNTPTVEEFQSLDQPSDYSTLLPDSAIQGPAGMPASNMLQSMGETPAGQGGNLLSGFNPTLGNTLGVAGGLAGLAGGIQSGNPYGITGGALGTAGNAASMLGYPGAGSLIGGLSGPLSLASGIQSGNPMSLASGALQTYQTVAQLASYFPELSQYLPSLGQLATNAIQAVAPTLAETLGLGATTAAAPAAGAAAEGVGTAAAGTAGTAGTAGLGAAVGVAALPAAILGGIFMKKDADEMASIINGMKETVRKRQELPGSVNTVAQAIQGTAGLPADLSTLSTPELMQQYQALQAAIPAIGNVREIIQHPSDAPSRIPRMDTTELQKFAQAEYNSVPLGLAALQDEFARRGVPLDQFWTPLGEEDILGMYGGAGNVTPEQLASIGPGNMLASLQALRAGQPLTNLPPALPGVGQARLSAAQQKSNLPLQGAELWGNYFLTPEQQQLVYNTGDWSPATFQRAMDLGVWSPYQEYTPMQKWQTLLGMYQVPQTPEGMYGQPQQSAPQAAPAGPEAPAAASAAAPVTGMPQPQTPAQAATLLKLLSRTPGFNAQGSAEDPYLPLLFAQYGLA